MEAPGAVPRRERGVIRAPGADYGTSYEGTPLRVWGHGEPDRPLILAGVHGEEVAGSLVASRALRTVDPEALTANVVLCANPDGAARGTRGNARGVDLNRNFPCRDWTAGDVFHRWDAVGAREVALSSGSSAGSEPEVRALLALVERLQPSCVVDIHTPLGMAIALDDFPLARRVAAQLGLRYNLVSRLSSPGMAATYFHDGGIPYVNVELAHDSLFAALPIAVDVFAALMVGPVT